MRRTCILLNLFILCMMLSGCGEHAPNPSTPEGIRREETLLTVDGRDVTAGEYLYWLTTICRGLEEQYAAAGKIVDWESPAEEGTLVDYVKNQALRSVALYATVENWAERCGCAITEEDRAQLTEQWRKKAESCGGEQVYLDRLAERGLDRTGAERMAEDHCLYGKLCALAGTEASPLYAADYELKAYFETMQYLTMRVLKFTGEDAASRAAEAFVRLNGAVDTAAEFDALGAGAAETYLPGAGVLPRSAFDAAAELGAGQVSGILEIAEETYAILLRTEDDLDAVRLPHLDHRLQTAADGADILVTEAYEKLDVIQLQETVLEVTKSEDRA